MGNTPIIDPWEEDVDLLDYDINDFESRDQRVPVSGIPVEIWSLIEGLSEEWGIKEYTCLDRSIRLYIAHILEEDYDPEAMREEWEMQVLLPPISTVDEYRVDIEPRDELETDRGKQTNFVTVYALRELMDELVEEGYADSRSQFVRDAVRYTTYNLD